MPLAYAWPYEPAGLTIRKPSRFLQSGRASNCIRWLLVSNCAAQMFTTPKEGNLVMVDQLAAAIVGHCVGDFLLQTDWMAKNKKVPWPKREDIDPMDSPPFAQWKYDAAVNDGYTGTFSCFIHAFVYSFCVMLFTGWLWHPAVWLIWLVVAVPHYLIDRTQFVKWYMNHAGQSSFAQPPMAPWSHVAVDNAFHLVCLYLTALWLSR